MRLLKRAADSKIMMNPGKIVDLSIRESLINSFILR